MNTTKSKEKPKLTHSKIYFIVLCLTSLLFAVLTHFALIYNSVIYYIFDEYATIAFFVFPFFSAASAIISLVILFKDKNLKFITPVIFSLVGCLLAFTLANDSSNKKIESDFLNHENLLNRIVEDFKDNGEGIYEIDEKELLLIAPKQKVIVKSVENGAFAYCIVTVDIDGRFEGYVFEPNGAPADWVENGQYSMPLDINEKWSYFIYIKGENYD